jgi:hypothetical protein
MGVAKLFNRGSYRVLQTGSQRRDAGPGWILRELFDPFGIHAMAARTGTRRRMSMLTVGDL